jgi:LPXTG-motif cell wall-anchored protein
MTRKAHIFTTMKWFYHKHLIYLAFLFILTGLPLLSETFHGVAYVFSFPFNFIAEPNGELLATGLQVCRAIHRVCALLLGLITIPFAFTMLMKIKPWQTPFGNYNTGQKVALWLLLSGMALITASGLVLWFRSFFGQALVEVSHMVHDAAFIVVVLSLLVHIYFVLFLRYKHGLEAMSRSGGIDEDIVRKPHGV